MRTRKNSDKGSQTCLYQRRPVVITGNFQPLASDSTEKFHPSLHRPHPIRLFVDAHVFDNEYQGSRSFIRGLYRSLLENEHLEICMAASDTDNLKREFGIHPRLHFHSYPSRSGWHRLLLHLPLFLKQKKFDYAHFQYMIPPVSVKGCQYVATIHDVIFREYPAAFRQRYRITKQLLYRDAARRSSLITTVSPYSKQSIVNFLGVDSNKVHIVQNGVEDVFFETYDPGASAAYIEEKYGLRNYVLYVSRIEPRKNHEALLYAWYQLRLHEQHCPLVLLGHPSLDVPGFHKLLRQLPPKAREQVFLHAGVPDKDLPELYRAARLFVYPSQAEGFGISPLEAGAARIPVICSNSSAMSSFTFFGKGHIDTSDTALLAETIRQFLDHPPAPAGLSAISNHIREEYAWSRGAERFYQLLNRHHPSSLFKKTVHDQLHVS